NEIDRALGNHVGRIALLLSRRGVLVPVQLAVVFLLRVVIDVARQQADELVEAVRVGGVLLAVAQVPLAKDRRAIAGVLEQFRQGRLGLRQTGLLLAGVDGPLQADALLPTAGHQRRPRRRADGAVGVEVRQPRALFRQLVDVRRLYVLAAV